MRDRWAEVVKVEVGATDSTGAEGKPDDPGDAAKTEVSLEDFEQLLKSRYRGSFSFYSKLSTRSRQEVYEYYVNGASVAEVRRKIMNRFRHER